MSILYRFTGKDVDQATVDKLRRSSIRLFRSGGKLGGNGKMSKLNAAIKEINKADKDKL